MKPAMPVHRTHDARRWANVRVTGALSTDARLITTTGREPHALLMLEFEPDPKVGLAYRATVDLGADVADHMGAQQDLPLMRCGALISVAGKALQLCADHGHAVLRVVEPCDVYIPLP